MRTLTRLVTATVASVALASTLAACSGTPDASEAYRDLVAGFEDADTGRFLYSLDAAGVEMMRSTGTYVLSTASMDTAAMLTDGETAQNSRRIDVGTASYTNTDVEAGPCWIADKAAPLDQQMAAAAVLLEGKATGWQTEDEILKGTTAVAPLVALLGELGAGIDLGDAADARVDMTALVDGETITAIRTDMGSVLRAVTENGGTIPEVLNAFTNEQVEIAMMVGYSEQGSKVTVEAPTTHLVPRGADTKTTKAAYETCTKKAAKAPAN